MTLLCKSRKEDQKPTASIVNPNKTRIGNWNVRTMFETEKAGQVAREMKRYKLDILGISKCKWRGSRKSKLNTGEIIIFYSGKENIHQGGIAIIIMICHNKQPDVLWSGHQKVVKLSEQGFIQSIGN